MQLRAALLADAASVRGNLLFVLGGGITRVRAPQVPAPMSVVVALVIEIYRTEVGRPHELLADVIDQDGTSRGKVITGFQVAAMPPELDVHERLQVPLVLDTRLFALPAYGFYSVEMAIDGQHADTLAFRLEPPPPLPTSEPPSP